MTTLAQVPTIKLVESLKQVERHSRSCKRAILHFNFLMDAIETELQSRANKAKLEILCKP